MSSELQINTRGKRTASSNEKKSSEYTSCHNGNIWLLITVVNIDRTVSYDGTPKTAISEIRCGNSTIKIEQDMKKPNKGMENHATDR